MSTLRIAPLLLASLLPFWPARGLRYPTDAFLGDTWAAATINNFMSETTGLGLQGGLPG